MSWSRRPSCILVLAALAGGCVETIEVSMRVTSQSGTDVFAGCPKKPGDASYINRIVVTTYPPVNGKCCGVVVDPRDQSAWSLGCPLPTDFEEKCFIAGGGGDAPTSDAINIALEDAGLALDWDPDRPTCLRIVAYGDTSAESSVRSVSVPCEDNWDAGVTEATVRICAHTSTPASGTGVIQVDNTRCASRVPSNPNPNDPPSREEVERAAVLACSYGRM